MNILFYPKKMDSDTDGKVTVYAHFGPAKVVYYVQRFQLGHTSLKTTQIYAKVLDSKISDDMEKLKNDPKLLEFAKNI